jgi:CRP-like cAMP-binding protein
VSFILEVFERLTKRGLADGATIPFPLRQHIIADALGLTQVHVSRIITALRKRGAIRLTGGKLTILDMGLLLSDV